MVFKVDLFESPTLRHNGIKTNKKPANHKIAGFLHLGVPKRTFIKSYLFAYPVAGSALMHS